MGRVIGELVFFLNTTSKCIKYHCEVARGKQTKHGLFCVMCLPWEVEPLEMRFQEVCKSRPEGSWGEDMQETWTVGFVHVSSLGSCCWRGRGLAWKDVWSLSALRMVFALDSVLDSCLEHKSYEKQLRKLGRLSLEKMRLMGDLLTLYSFLTGGCGELGVGPFSQVAGNRLRGNGLKLYWECLDWILWKISSLKALSSPGIKSFVESPSLDVFQGCVDVALKDMVSCRTNPVAGLMADLEDFSQPKWFNDSVIILWCQYYAVRLQTRYHFYCILQLRHLFPIILGLSVHAWLTALQRRILFTWIQTVEKETFFRFLLEAVEHKFSLFN